MFNLIVVEECKLSSLIDGNISFDVSFLEGLMVMNVEFRSQIELNMPIRSDYNRSEVIFCFFAVKFYQEGILKGGEDCLNHGVVVFVVVAFGVRWCGNGKMIIQ